MQYNVVMESAQGDIVECYVEDAVDAVEANELAREHCEDVDVAFTLLIEEVVLQ